MDELVGANPSSLRSRIDLWRQSVASPFAGEGQSLGSSSAGSTDDIRAARLRNFGQTVPPPVPNASGTSVHDASPWPETGSSNAPQTNYNQQLLEQVCDRFSSSMMTGCCHIRLMPVLFLCFFFLCLFLSVTNLQFVHMFLCSVVVIGNGIHQE